LKRTRKERNHDAIKPIYLRGASSVPAELLAVHREADKETKDKILAAAQERREQRNARRFKISS
jgi:hypothetical protein